jgi:hypothetical protein
MNPLYVTGHSENGRPIIGGLYHMKDQCGFPLDYEIEECRQRYWLPDYIEILADAGSQSIQKMDRVCKELELLIPEQWDEIWKKWLVLGSHSMKECSDFEGICKAILKEKREYEQIDVS